MLEAITKGEVITGGGVDEQDGCRGWCFGICGCRYMIHFLHFFTIQLEGGDVNM
jgi:hypothetical protein